MKSEYIRREDAFDAVEARIAELMTHPEFRRKHLDIDLSGIIRNISAIKPADVVPVRHGKWKKIGVWGRVYRCDQCGNFLDFDGVNAGRGSANFCPNCGAKMEKED